MLCPFSFSLTTCYWFSIWLSGSCIRTRLSNKGYCCRKWHRGPGLPVLGQQRGDLMQRREWPHRQLGVLGWQCKQRHLSSFKLHSDLTDSRYRRVRERSAVKGVSCPKMLPWLLQRPQPVIVVATRKLSLLPSPGRPLMQPVWTRIFTRSWTQCTGGELIFSWTCWNSILPKTHYTECLVSGLPLVPVGFLHQKKGQISSESTRKRRTWLISNPANAKRGQVNWQLVVNVHSGLSWQTWSYASYSTLSDWALCAKPAYNWVLFVCLAQLRLKMHLTHLNCLDFCQRSIQAWITSKCRCGLWVIGWTKLTS